jgi:hypothetical protein
VSGTTNTAVTCSLSPQVGTITNGVYQAPAIIGSQQTVTVTATSVADPTKIASATLSLLSAGVVVGVTVGPATVPLGAGASATFHALVTGTSNTAVTWSLNPAVGAVVKGVYTAPATISSLLIVTLTATSVANSTKFAIATITLTPMLANLPNTPHFGNDGAQLSTYVP